MDYMLNGVRSVLAVRVQQRLQRYLDDYDAGLMVQPVNINEAQPPREVRAAFDDVQRAKEDERRVVEGAEAYRNKVLPEARGRAQRMIEESSAYKEEVVARAEGETSRFLAQLAAFEKAPDVTRERIYISTMESVLSKTNKVLVDVNQGNNMMLLPLDRMAAAGAALARDPAPETGMTSQDLDSRISQLIEESLSRQANSQNRRGR